MLLDNANSFLDCQVIRLSAKEYYKVKEIIQNPLLYGLKSEESFSLKYFKSVSYIQICTMNKVNNKKSKRTPTHVIVCNPKTSGTPKHRY